MNRLKILMADDQQGEVEDARKALKDMAHDVIAVSTFDEAMKHAQNEIFDIAVVDLGWFTDNDLKGRMSDENMGSLGWKILDLIQAKNPNTVRILYSARTDDPKITQAATEQNIYCIQKKFTKEGRLHLADVVKVIAHHLAIEKNLANKVETIEAELEKAQTKIREFEKLKAEADSEKQKFNRLLLSVMVVPTVAFILFIAAWLLTQQLVIATLAFVGGAFLLLAFLLATKAITLQGLKQLGDLLKSLFPRSGAD
jgi:response regulator RpfG family c-di-GMP phosphodiesterase